MLKISITAPKIPTGTKPEFLFNKPGFKNKPENDHIALGKDLEGKKLLLQFRLFDNSIHSGAGLPFGGIDPLGNRPSSQAISDFFKKLVPILQEKGIREVTIDLPPESYDEELVMTQVKVLLNLGFTLEAETMSFHIPCSDSMSPGLHPSLMRKVKASMRAGYEMKMNSTLGLKRAYENILRWRSIKGIPLNIEFRDLERQIHLFRDNYDLFEVLDKDRIIAAGIGVRVSRRVYYKFIPGTDPDYDKFSPMVFLSLAMHNRAQELGCEIFDLGIAGPLDGPENAGLAAFKSRLGGVPSLKCRLKGNF